MPSTTTQRKLASQFISVTNATKENAQQVWIPRGPVALRAFLSAPSAFGPISNGPSILSRSLTASLAATVSQECELQPRCGCQSVSACDLRIFFSTGFLFEQIRYGVIGPAGAPRAVAGRLTGRQGVATFPPPATILPILGPGSGAPCASLRSGEALWKKDRHCDTMSHNVHVAAE